MRSFLARLFGANDAIQPYIDRVAFLMAYFERHGLQDKGSVVKALQSELLLNIPENISDPEERVWNDPSNSDMGISFSCNPMKNPILVNQFIIHGFGVIANTLIIGTANNHEDGSMSFTWSTCPESDARPVPVMARKLQERFWSISGYTIVGLGEYKFLMHE